MAASEIVMTNGATPATPGSGTTKIFVSTGKVLSSVDDSGKVVAAFGGGSQVQAQPGDPTGNATTTATMMGLGSSCALTPAATGRILILVSGVLTNSTATAGDGATAQIAYGTGAAPANAAVASGTTVGNIAKGANERAASDFLPFTCQAIVTGLTIGTAYWFDLQVAALVAGTGQVKNLSMSVIEL